MLLCLLFSACANEDIEKWPEKGNYYDSGKPVAFESMSPNWGRINDNFVIKGNFPSDTSHIKVFFGDKEAVMLSSDGREAYGLIPKEAPGYNKVTLVVDGEKYNSDNVKFKYYQTQSVKTVVGKFGERSWTDNVILSEARLDACNNISVVKGKKNDNIIFQATGWGDRTYFVSFEDNIVQKLIGIGFLGGLACDNTGEKVAIMERGGGNLYTATRNDGWTISSLGLKVPMSGDCVGSMAFSKDNNNLFVMGGEGLWSVDLANKTSELVLRASEQGDVFKDVNMSQWNVYLCYSKYDDCFFVSYPDQNGIIKMWKDADGKWKAERYAGFKPGWYSTAMGDRLLDAVLKKPMGMAVNSDGELYVCVCDSHCIVKIKGRLVSLVAGHPDNSGNVNGFPTDAYLNNPSSISIDSDENFYIGENSSGVIRKMTIE